jgi:hypothetical protein
MNDLLRPRNWEPACGTERSVASANYMAVLPGVLGCRSLRRTVQVRLGTNTLRLPGTRRKRLRCAWHVHLRGLATAIHEISGLVKPFS